MSDFDDFLSDFYDQYDNAAAWFGGADIDLTNAKLAWNIPDDHGAIGALIGAVEHCIDALAYWFDRYTYNYPRYNLVKLFLLTDERLNALEVDGDYELTLVKMIEAYINAHDDHRSAHRLLLDAYQASMYDKPFDREYHADWVRRFRSWA